MKKFEAFLSENYYANLSKSTIDKKKAQMKKQASMDDDDPEAYKELPGDTKGKENLKTSKHTKKYHELYEASEASEGSLPGELKWIYDEPFKKLTLQKNGTQKKESFKELEINKIDKKDALSIVKDLQSEDYLSWNILKSILQKKKVQFQVLVESEINEKEQSTNRSPIDSEAIESGLKKKSEETGVPIGILRAVMRRGMAAWKSGHRPGAGQEQWGYARCNSFITGGEGTWGRPLKDPKSGADSDLAREAIKAGFMPK